MEGVQNVSLLIDGRVFKANKNTLSEYSDYFRAMFSGNYIEQEQQEIIIDVVDADSMSLVLRYMEIGLIDLSEHSLSTIRDLALAANFLQITELIKQIEYCLELQLSFTKWAEILSIAESASYMKLEQSCVIYGLFNFQYMKPEYISNIQRLCWYLSHPYLITNTELYVFKFGFEWITNEETGADALLIILGCLDYSKMHSNDLKEITVLIKDYANSLAAKVVECLQYLMENKCELATSEICNQRTTICENFTERVYHEVYNLLNGSVKRVHYLTPVVPMWFKDTKLAASPHYLHTFNEKSGFEKWLEVGDKNLWGWNIVPWGFNKLVVVCGEVGRGTGTFMRDVRVYDTLRKEWISHGVQLPKRRHGCVAIVGDLLYIVGGVGGFRVTLDQSLVYDLIHRSYRKIAQFPDTIQDPSMCVHNNMVYANGHTEIFRYEDLGETDRWVPIVRTEIRSNSMTSYKDYIYSAHSFFSHLYRFRPDIDKRMELVTDFSNPPAAICNLGNRLVAFTRPMFGNSETIFVEEYIGDTSGKNPKVIWSHQDLDIKINEVAGSCSLVMTTPPVKHDFSQYHLHYLRRYQQ